MGGVWGLWEQQPTGQSAPTAEAIARALARRGSPSRWTNQAARPSVSLGGCGVSVYTDADGSAIAADARIDNRAELWGQLRHVGQTSPDGGDSALILCAYRVWSDAFVERLIGDFALLIWDAPQQRLIAARDPMGIKPLFYTHDDSRIAFASDIRALLTLPNIQRRADPVMIGIYLSQTLDFSGDSGRTFFQGIARLPDHHRLIAAPDGDRLTVQIESYWQPDSSPDTHFTHDNDYAEAFRALLEQAIRSRLHSWEDRPDQIGAALSGGMDSSSVVCLLRAALGDHGQFHSFYMQPEVAAADESRYVDAVLSDGGLLHHRGMIPGLLHGGATIYDVLDVPSLWMNFPLSLSMYRLAASLGVRAFFDGMDGDMAISHGRRYLTELLAGGQRAHFAAETRALAAAQGVSAYAMMVRYAFPHLNSLAQARRWRALSATLRHLSADFGTPALALGWYWGRNYIAPDWFAQAWQHARHGEPLRLQAWQVVNPMLSSAFVRQIDLESRLRDNAQPPPLDAREEQLRPLRSGRLPAAFEECDAIGAAVGIVPLHPLSDQRIVQFCVGLPGDQRVRGGLTRSILRRALVDLLPEAIATRGDKTDFAPAFIHAFQTYDLPIMEALFARDLGAAAAFVEPSAVRAAYAEVKRGRISLTRLLALVRLARLIWWLESFEVKG